MSCCFVPVKKSRWLVILLTALSMDSVWAAPGSCSTLAAMPAAVEIDQGIQQNISSPVAITRIAVGDPKIADVHVSGNDGFLLTGVAQGTSSSAPRQSMVFVRGRATASMVETASAPSGDAQLPSQVQTDIRFVEVSRSKLKEASTSIFGKGSNNFLFGAPGTVPGVNVTPGTVSATKPNIPLNNSNFNIVWGGGSSKVLGMLNAMENSGYAYTLARPSLVAAQRPERERVPGARTQW